MIFDVPILLILAYAIFRACEYFALKSYQDFNSPFSHDRRMSAIHGTILFPARVFGWGALIWFMFKAGIWTTLILVLIAFPVSLLVQAILTYTVLRLEDHLWRPICLAAVPIMAVVIIIIIASY